jgi:hypothetical protein
MLRHYVCVDFGLQSSSQCSIDEQCQFPLNVGLPLRSMGLPLRYEAFADHVDGVGLETVT